MNSCKIQRADAKDKAEVLDHYDHYIAVDWSKKVMAIARLTPSRTEPTVIERPADVKELRLYLSQLQGRKIITLEETTSAHWLYLEVREYVERIIVCDPYRNRLLCDGPKTDPIDAAKLCVLLRAGLLKEVFHRDDEVYRLRRLVSAYDDLVKAGVRSLNQKAAVVRAEGFPTDIPKETPLRFVLEHLEKSIALYDTTKAEYEKQFEKLCRKNTLLRAQVKLHGIGVIGAVKILSSVVDARRFPSAGHYLSYCGLVKLVKLSGQRSYGQRSPRHNHTLKAVYKTAAMGALRGQNPIREYYEYLVQKGVAEHNARHTVARYIAKVSYGMLKHGTEYQPYRWRTTETAQNP
ncbi:MAG: transposase [Bacteroidota bacterium]